MLPVGPLRMVRMAMYLPVNRNPQINQLYMGS